ncbi:MAG: hypothetical protein U0183_25300 [Polyangiaceae bacterium]
MANALGSVGIREAAGDERLRDLFVEIRTVGDDDQGRVLVHGIAPKLEREPKHREALSRALRVPHDAAALGGLLCRACAGDGLVHRCELLIPAELANDSTGLFVTLEHDEVAHQVEEGRGREHTLEEDLLGIGLAAELAFHVVERARVRSLPLHEEAVRREHGAVRGGLPAGRNQDLNGLEELRRTKLAVALLHLLVARELIDGFELPPLAKGRALALDDPHRDPVHEEHHVGADVLLGAVHLELPRDDELVCRHVLEVEVPNRVALLAVAEVLFEGDAVSERGVQLLAGLDEARDLDPRDGAHGLVHVVVRDPRVQLPNGRSEPRDEHDLLERFALSVEHLGSNIRPPEPLEMSDRGVLGERLLVPASPAAHGLPSGSPSTVR